MEKIKAVALIPARAGSKGIIDKNLKELCGKPLIYYTIDSAKKAQTFDDIIISTDSKEIAKIAEEFGANAPFIRPEHLAKDGSTQMDVIIHAMDWLEENNKKYDHIFYLQPTSPLRSDQDILNSFELLKKKNANAVVSVTEITGHHPLWMNTLPDDGNMDNFIKPEAKNTNRQNLPKHYRLNGAVYLAKWDYLKEFNDWYKERCYAYIMPNDRSIDIDTEIDLITAEYLLKRTKK